MFSARCVELLARAGYKAEWFGSYDHVAEQIRAAKKKCADFDGGVSREAPTAEDRYLAGCQSGHLVQNAVFQNERGNPCSNVAPGHEDNLFPCMPQAGHAMQPGGEHQRATVDEQSSAGAHGSPGSTYPAGAIRDDANARAQSIVEDRELAQRNHRAPTSAEQQGTRATGVSTNVAGAGSAADTSGATGQQASRPNARYQQEIGGETAADCINNFRDAAEDAMRQACADQRERNRRIADGGPGRTPQQGEEHRAALRTQADGAEQAAAASPDDENLQRAARRARTRATRADRAFCRANQGDRIANGETGPFDGVVPRNAVNNPTDSARTTGPSETEI